MLAFHNDPQIKTKYLGRVKAHYEADEIQQGFYWEKGKGCAVGCTIHGSNHSAYETELGIPRVLARLEDRIFEGLRNGEAKEWPVKFLSTIKSGQDLSMVSSQFMHWIVTDKQGIYKHANLDTRKAMAKIAKLYAKRLKGSDPTPAQWKACSDEAWKVRHAAAADADAAYAAYAAAYAAYAADAAAYAAAYAADAADAAAYAADAAAYAAYAADARNKQYQRMAKKLLALIKAAPMGNV